MLQHYLQQNIEEMIYACNSQNKPGYAWKANGVFISNIGLEINFMKYFQPNTLLFHIY